MVLDSSYIEKINYINSLSNALPPINETIEVDLPDKGLTLFPVGRCFLCKKPKVNISIGKRFSAGSLNLSTPEILYSFDINIGFYGLDLACKVNVNILDWEFVSHNIYPLYKASTTITIPYLNLNFPFELFRTDKTGGRDYYGNPLGNFYSSSYLRYFFDDGYVLKYSGLSGYSNAGDCSALFTDYSKADIDYLLSFQKFTI